MKFLSLLSFMLISSLASAAPTTVPYVDLNMYVGRWFQMAANPTTFERGCFCAQQTLTPPSNGKVGVYNSCNLNSANGRLSDIRGTAAPVDTQTFAKLEVDFGLPWKGEYWIIGLAGDYSWAVVTDSKGDTLYVLSRTPEMSAQAYGNAVAAAAAAQVDTSKLVRQPHQGCSYPPL